MGHSWWLELCSQLKDLPALIFLKGLAVCGCCFPSFFLHILSMYSNLMSKPEPVSGSCNFEEAHLYVFEEKLPRFKYYCS